MEETHTTTFFSTFPCMEEAHTTQFCGRLSLRELTTILPRTGRSANSRSSIVSRSPSKITILSRFHPSHPSLTLFPRPLTSPPSRPRLLVNGPGPVPVCRTIFFAGYFSESRTRIPEKWWSFCGLRIRGNQRVSAQHLAIRGSCWEV